MQEISKSEREVLIAKSIETNIDTYHAIRHSLDEKETETLLRDFVQRFTLTPPMTEELVAEINRSKQNRLEQTMKSLHRAYRKGYTSERQNLKIKAIFRREGRREELDKQPDEP